MRRRDPRPCYNPRPRALALGNLGDAYLRRGMVEAAEQHTGQALRILTELGDRRYAGSVLADLGRIRAHAGKIEQAVDAWRRALALLSPHDRKAREVRSRLAEADRAED